MNISTIIIDNFLDNPDLVRESALNADFSMTGNYPGSRSDKSDANYSNFIKKKIEDILNTEILEWDTCYNAYTSKIEESSTTRFQLCTEDAVTWIHFDPSEWTGILYLNPGAPVDSGTAIYRHKKTGIYINTIEEWADDKDIEEWEIITFIGNLYNRLALFKGNMYHRSVVPGFGTDKHTGRLTQTFFFSTTPKDIKK